jgi:hypothetical protein
VKEKKNFSIQNIKINKIKYFRLQTPDSRKWNGVRVQILKKKILINKIKISNRVTRKKNFIGIIQIKQLYKNIGI